MSEVRRRLEEALAARRPLVLPDFGRIRASALVVLLAGPEGPRVALTRRSAELSAHAGEISLPGGRPEVGDRDSLATALREAEEEIGLQAADCRFLGTLDETPTITGFLITPHVVWVERLSAPLRPSRTEVAELLEVPLELFLDGRPPMTVKVEHGNARGAFPLFVHRGELIWGATARIMANLRALVAGSGPSSPLTPVIRTLLPLLAVARRVVLTTHINPDPDGLGAQMALEELALALGKEVVVANSDPIPERFSYMSFRSPVVTGEQITAGLASPEDLLLIVDTGEAARLGRAACLLPGRQAMTVVLDHHLRGDITGAAVLVEKRYCSTSEIVYELLDRIGFPFTVRAASRLYDGLLFDTAGFRFVNGRSEPFRVGANLVDLGADPTRAQESLFCSVGRGYAQLLGLALGRARYECDGRYAWSHVSRAELEELGATDEDAGEVAPFLVTLAGVRVAAFLRELPDGRHKVALRSRHDYPIGAICRRHGGGGHANAGGATMTGSAEQIGAQLLADVEEVVRGA